MKHVRILTYSLGNLTNGQARCARTLALGLRWTGLETSIECVWATPEALAELESQGISARSLRSGHPSSSGRQLEVIRPGRMLGRLAANSTQDGQADWILVVSDELISIGAHLGHSQRNAYLCQGDFMVLFFSDATYRDGRLRKTLASSLASTTIRSHARDVRAYDLLLGNSEFTRGFMSYLYGVPLEGVCYPPVDPNRFRPGGIKADPPFALAVARNLHEQGIATLERIASVVPLKVVGGLKVRGSESLGVVSDEVLAALYSQARLVVAPVVSEFFGYSVAESLTSGTPVACYSVCGPGEQVRTGVNGWVASGEDALVESVADAMRPGAALPEPAAVRESSRRFWVENVAEDLRVSLSRKETGAPAGRPAPGRSRS